MSQHTPGPWTAFQGTAKRPRSKKKFIFFGVNGPMSNRTTTGLLCERICDLPFPVEYEGHQAANARLIAASPDLLDACQLLAETYLASGKCLGCANADRAARMAIAAIAKVEGTK